MNKIYIQNNVPTEQGLYTIPDNFTGIVEYSDKTKIWYVNGILNRLDGPAIEWFDGTVEYWIDGEHFIIKNTESFILLVNVMKLKGLI